jgi:Leucine-rich repeat (LRR) protein
LDINNIAIPTSLKYTLLSEFIQLKQLLFAYSSELYIPSSIDKTLQAFNCSNSVIEGLSNLCQLQTLACNDSNVTDKDLVNLTNLNCSRTRISDISKLTNVRMLNCSNTNISDLSHLQNLEVLIYIVSDVSRRKITDVRMLPNLKLVIMYKHQSILVNPNVEIKRNP